MAMKNKIIGILIFTILIFATVYPITAKMNTNITSTEVNNLGMRDGWALQWSHA